MCAGISGGIFSLYIIDNFEKIFDFQYTKNIKGGIEDNSHLLSMAYL